MYRNHKLQWVQMSFLGTFHLLALAALFFPFKLSYLPVMVGVYLWIGFATTLYLHRCLTHKALELPGWLKFVLCLGTAVGQQGDPVAWVGHHRWHHAKTDKPDEDVHSPLAGFIYSHFGWIIRDPGEEDERMRKLASDVREKYWYARLGENNVIFFMPHLIMAVTLYLTLGFGGMLWCFYVPMVVLYNATWSVNSLCHMPQFGYRSANTPDQSRNFWLIGLLGLGEGWHNNHHACQTRAPQGLTWYEVDLTAYLIAVLEKLGLAWNVRWHAPVRTTSLQPTPAESLATAG